jgi:hypothetical protein
MKKTSEDDGVSLARPEDHQIVMAGLDLIKSGHDE